MKIRVTVYKLGDNQTIISLPSYIVEKYGGMAKFKLNRFPFIARITRQIKLNRSASTHVRGVVTIPKKISDYLNLKNKQQVELILE